ncbi:Cytochrome P450 2B11 [Mycena sanguinolenta]|uniref:Cytochrome P450 2B11 n=1 Tax=Mycena sanguinolenta TaxID=230812 RepID=A0A8H7DER7_9AGAR|nr:Cytochrome P450 2B11 [Mycena sanguinolenta]
MDRLPLQPVTMAAIALLAGVYFVRSRTVVRARRPPGPPGLPLLGNVFQVPAKHLATYFRGLCKEYGGFVSLNLAGFAIFLIGDIRLAKEILEKRSAKFSSRPIFPYVRYHVDPAQVYWGHGKQDETHFIARRLTAGLMAAVRAGETEPLQQFEALLNMTHLLDDGGKNWFNHMDRVSASMVLAAGFGLHCPTGQEPDLKEVIACIAEFISLSTPSASIMNFLPFLDIIPGSMPWRKRARTHRNREDALYDRLITRAVSGEASGMNTWAAAFAREDKPEGDQRRLMNQFTTAAIETAYCGVNAYREIDAIVGEDRLPSFKDRPRLPYIEAIRPFDGALHFVLDFPHQSTADDVVEYEGKEYFIPNGSIILAVTWAIEHDHERFENHDLFQPERFLDDTNNLKAGYETSAFGFGRRGKSDEPDARTGFPFKYDDSDLAFHGEFTNAPFKFPAVFEPRSVKRAEVVRQEWADCEKNLNVLLPRHKEQ